MSCQITCVSTATAPITQQSRTSGNESLVNTEPVRTPLGVVNVPVLSGNALRHCSVRAPLAEHLVDSLDLCGKLTKDLLDLLFHGGRLRGSNMRIDLARVAELERLLPALALLGGCLPDVILPGTLQVLRGTLVCRENAARIASSVPDGWWPEQEPQLAPAISFVSRWQYVRGAAVNSEIHLIDDKEGLADTEMMPYAGTAVIPGSVFAHGYTVDSKNDLQIGALLFALDRWSSEGGVVGGQSARGHGRLDVRVAIPDGLNARELIDVYLRHVSKTSGEARDWLCDTYDVLKDVLKEGAA